MRLWSKICSVLLAVFLLAGMTGCSMEQEPASSEIYLMSTTIRQLQVCGSRNQQAVEAVNARLAELDQMLSLYQEDSDIDRINQSAGQAPVRVNEYTFTLLSAAKEYCERSEGLFDITIAPLTTLWGIGSDHARVPEPAELDAALALVDHRALILDEAEQTAFLQEPGMAIDLGGVAKGYMAAAIGEIYEEYGVTGAIVSIGGNICTYGEKPNGDGYVLGIRDPLGRSESSILGTLQTGDTVVATSGAYERYLEQDGTIYHHILDPKTGYPAKTDLLSVTVISPDGGLADYLSTVLFMAGSEAIESYRNHEDFQVIVVDAEKRVHLSDSLKDAFELVSDDYVLAEEQEEP